METGNLNSTFVMVGSGNMAFSLGKALVDKGHVALGVVSRNPNTGKELASILHSDFMAEFPNNVNPDYVFLCVADSQIGEATAMFTPLLDAVVCHCSGSTGLNIIAHKVKKAGVLYPLQSFSKSVSVDWSKVPVLVEGTSPEIADKIMLLAGSLSSNIALCDSDKRLHYHLAAVIVNNFTNHLMALSQRYCTQNQLDFSKLQPLLIETLRRVQTANAHDLQTGPAVRNDSITIKKHLELLADNPQLKEVYEILTKSISKNRGGN